MGFFFCTTRCLSSDKLESGVGADRGAERGQTQRTRWSGRRGEGRRKKQGQLHWVLCFSLFACLYTDVTVCSAARRTLKALVLAVELCLLFFRTMGLGALFSPTVFASTHL